MHARKRVCLRSFADIYAFMHVHLGTTENQLAKLQCQPNFFSKPIVFA